MEKITKITSEALKRYYNSLFKLGYKNYTDVNNLLVLTFLEELLEYDSYQFITEEDYNTIIKALYCMLGNSYNIEFPSYAAFVENEVTFRISENGDFRTTETSIFRTKA